MLLKLSELPLPHLHLTALVKHLLCLAGLLSLSSNARLAEEGVEFQEVYFIVLSQRQVRQYLDP